MMSFTSSFALFSHQPLDVFTSSFALFPHSLHDVSASWLAFLASSAPWCLNILILCRQVPYPDGDWQQILLQWLCAQPLQPHACLSGQEKRWLLRGGWCGQRFGGAGKSCWLCRWCFTDFSCLHYVLHDTFEQELSMKDKRGRVWVVTPILRLLFILMFLTGMKHFYSKSCNWLLLGDCSSRSFHKLCEMCVMFVQCFELQGGLFRNVHYYY